MRKITKRSAAIIAGSALALTGGTAAFAIASGWFSGDGTVYAASSSIQTVHASANLGSTAETRLFPGRTVTVTGTVNNPNDYQVLINSISVNTVTSNKTGCGKTEADLQFGSVPANTVIAAGTSPSTVGLGTISMGSGAQPVCAGAVFAVTAAMTGEIQP